MSLIGERRRAGAGKGIYSEGSGRCVTLCFAPRVACPSAWVRMCVALEEARPGRAFGGRSRVPGGPAWLAAAIPALGRGRHHASRLSPACPRSRSGSCGRRQQKRREVPPGGGGRDESGRRSAEPSVPTPPCVPSGGKGRGTRPPEGDARWPGGWPSSGGGVGGGPPPLPRGESFLQKLPAGPQPFGAPSPEPSERAASQPGPGTPEPRCLGCSRGPAAGDGRLRLARLALVLLGWVSSTSSSSASSSTSSASLLAPAASGQPAPGRCPAPCECLRPRAPSCVNRNLTEVPADLPPYVRNLFPHGQPAGRAARRRLCPPAAAGRPGRASTSAATA